MKERGVVPLRYPHRWQMIRLSGRFFWSACRRCHRVRLSVYGLPPVYDDDIVCYEVPHV